MKVLIAGGAGFIGNHLSRSLLRQGHEVVCVDDLSTGAIRNVADLVDDDRYQFIEADVAKTPGDRGRRHRAPGSPASPVDYDRMPMHTMRANSLGMYRLLDVASAVGARLCSRRPRRSTATRSSIPSRRRTGAMSIHVGPRSCYDEAKRVSEALLFAARRETGVQANVVRLFNTYGPGMRHDDGRVSRR